MLNAPEVYFSIPYNKFYSFEVLANLGFVTEQKLRIAPLWY